MKNEVKKFKLASECVCQTRNHRGNYYVVKSMKTNVFSVLETRILVKLVNGFMKSEHEALRHCSNHENLWAFAQTNTSNKNYALHLLNHANLRLFFLHLFQSYLNEAMLTVNQGCPKVKDIPSLYSSRNILTCTLE